MIFFRVIPVILIDDNDCIKTIKFNKRIYLGDPINIIKIFNDLGVDEIIIINISKKTPDYGLLKEMSEESFVPLTFGGGIKSINSIEKILSIGFEKVILNSCFYNNFDFLKDAIKIFGSSSISLSINLKKNLFKRFYLYDHLKKKILKNYDLDKIFQTIQEIHTSEICFNFVDYEGTRNGYDRKIISKIISSLSNRNILINGGAKNLEDIIFLKNLKCSGAVASSLFSFLNSNESILINYISENERNLIQNS